jgi:hypothetical protein
MAAPADEVPTAMAVEAPIAEAIPVADAPIPFADDAPIAAEAVPMAEEAQTPAPMAEALPDAPPAAPATISDAGLATMPAAAEPAPAVHEAAAATAAAIPAGAQPRLIVQRGQKRNVEFPIYEGQNFIGRSDEKPVDIDLEDQEPPDRVWSSRQHAVIIYENGSIMIEDLNSSNGTFVNRAKIHPGQPRHLVPNDVIQIGTVQLKLLV